MDIFSTYASDAASEESGKEIQIGDNTFITVARAGNKRYNRLLAKAYDTNKFTLSQKGPEAEARAEQIIIDVMANAILLGWRGDVTYKGKALEYSIENAKLLLAIKDFREAVSKMSEDFNNFKLEVEESNAKN